MSKDKLLDRIQKLLNLSNSSNPNEAAAALEKVQQLMLEHALTELDIKEHQITEARVKDQGLGSSACYSDCWRLWRVGLMAARSFQTRGLLGPNYSDRGQGQGTSCGIYLDSHVETACKGPRRIPQDLGFLWLPREAAHA